MGTEALAYHIQTAVRLALSEDLSLGDVTTGALFSDRVAAQGTIRAREPLVVAGIAVAREVFRSLDPSIEVVQSLADGRKVTHPTPLLTLRGDGRMLLIGERVALNFLQRLSGIATLTAAFRDAVRGFPTKIVDTRKTTPGLRMLEKWAVRLGGGRNHRNSLGDGLLIKDNHLALVPRGRQRVLTACRRARETAPHGMRICVEAQSLGQVKEALEGRADVILLDNMDPRAVRKAVTLIGGRALIEVSGGITLERARAMAEAGADYLSIGALTHSAPAVDVNMDIRPIARSTRRG